MKTPRYNELNTFYGRPHILGKPHIVDPKWVANQLTLIDIPYPMYTAWDGKLMRRLRVHKKCAAAMLSCLEEIGQKVSEFDRKLYQLDRCGGTYNHRPQRGNDWDRLSVHAYAAAIDLAPALNPLGVRYGSRKNMMPMEVVKIFADHGATWGGLWQRPDAMHFQFCDI